MLEKALASANQIQDSRAQGYALSAITEIFGKLNRGEKAAPLLEKALASANQFQDSNDKASAFGAIAEAGSKPEKLGTGTESYATMSQSGL